MAIKIVNGMARRAQWDRIAEEYDKSAGEEGDFNHRKYFDPAILKLLGDAEGKRVLDLGCGNGYFAVLLAKRGARVVGVDVSERMIAIAKGHAPRGLGIGYLAGNISDIGIKGGSFDCIISNMAFHNIADIGSTAEECARVLKRDGKLIFTMVHPMRDAAEIKKDGKGYHAEVKDYGRSRRVANLMAKKRGWGTVDSYHRPLGAYFDSLISAGFAITGFKEIYTSYENGVKITDRKLLRFKGSFPSFLVIQCTKLK